MKLNQNNYFTVKNKYISSHKLKSWLKDKNYFYRRHVLGEIEHKETPAFLLGRAVDCWLTEGEKKFRKDYKKVQRRDLKNPPKQTEMPEKEYEKAVSICKKVEEQEAYKELKGYQSQQILQYDIDLGMFDGICGIPDWFKIENDKCAIVDLKTSASINPNKYHWRCEDYGYYMQMAMYSILINLIYGVNINNFEYKHLVIEKDTDEIYNTQAFILSPERIEAEQERIVDILYDIKNEKEFAPQKMNWSDAILIGSRAD